MPDRLDTLFAELRTETVGRIRPPGAAAVRRSVRRRRYRRVAGMTLVLTAVAGGGYTGGLLPARPGPGPGPAPAAGTLAALQREAAAAIRLGTRPASFRGGVGTVTDDREAVGRLAAGTYQLRLACAGAGRVTMTLHTTRRIEHLGQRCDTAAAPLTVPVVVSAPGPATLDLQPDDADGPLAYAYELALSEPDQRRLTDGATGRLPASGRGLVLGPELLIGSLDGAERAAAGRYRFEAACAGAGTVTVTAQARRAGTLTGEANRTVSCGPGGTAVTMSLDLGDGDTVGVSMRPDPDAVAQAAGVVRYGPD